MRAELVELLLTHLRVAVVGGPRTGKTTLISVVDWKPTVSTDSFQELPWSEVPLVVNEKLAGLSEFVVEGVQAARCLRKGLEVDAVIYLTIAKVALTPRQSGMAKSVRTVFAEWRATHRDVPVFMESR